MALTEKMKAFCREYIANGGNGTDAYLNSYDTSNKTTAMNESSLLLKRKDINEYLRTLSIPLENKAISEREKVKKILWDRLQLAIERDDDLSIVKYTDQINRMNAEYINVNRNIDETNTNINELDTSTLLQLVK